MTRLAPRPASTATPGRPPRPAPQPRPHAACSAGARVSGDAETSARKVSSRWRPQSSRWTINMPSGPMSDTWSRKCRRVCSRRWSWTARRWSASARSSSVERSTAVKALFVRSERRLPLRLPPLELGAPPLGLEALLRLALLPPQGRVQAGRQPEDRRGWRREVPGAADHGHEAPVELAVHPPHLHVGERCAEEAEPVLHPRLEALLVEGALHRSGRRSGVRRVELPGSRTWLLPGRDASGHRGAGWLPRTSRPGRAPVASPDA